MKKNFFLTAAETAELCQNKDLEKITGGLLNLGTPTIIYIPTRQPDPYRGRETNARP